MNVTNASKKLLFYTFVSLLVTNCGGGGGGGGSSPAVKQEKPANVTIVSAAKPNNKELEEDIIANSKNVSIINYARPNDTTNKDMTIGIIDGDFLTDKEKIQQDYPGIEIIENGENFKPSGSKHAQKILKLLRQNDKIKFVAASIGEKKIVTIKDKKTEKKVIKPNIEVYRKVFDRLKNENIKIVNQSWGTAHDSSIEKKNHYLSLLISPQNLIKAREMVDFYKEKVENDNALFIWANGNYKVTLADEKVPLDHASVQAQLPLRVPELEKGWITVVGVAPLRATTLPNGENGYIRNSHYEKHLAYPAEAKNWAISASGTGIGDGGYGSSFAAPRVTRVAVELAKKYEWMTPNQIREVLFTTTDRPELLYDKNGQLYPGQEIRYTETEADPKYGWGVINPERAMLGPGAFNKVLLGVGDKENKKFIANLPDERVSAFQNDIHGDGGLVKRGHGRLLLGGENTFAESTQVEEGILDIYKGHKADVEVKKEGILALHKDARLGHDLLNEGKVALVGYNNRAVVEGDFTSTPESTVEYEVGSKLTVKGMTKLQEPKLAVIVKDYTTNSGEKKDIIESEKLEGEFKEVEVNGSRVVYVSENKDVSINKLTIVIKREKLLDYLKNEMDLDKLEDSMVDTANNIEKVLTKIDEKVENGTATTEDLDLGSEILELSATELADSTNKMSGEIYASAQALTFEQSANINQNLSNHLGSLRAFKASNYEWQAWMDGILGNGKIKDDGYAEAKTKISGTQFGLDKKIDNKTQIGVGFNYSYVNADFNRYAGRYNSDGVGISLYAKRYFPEDVYLLGKIGVNRYSTRVRREILDKSLESQLGDIKHHDKMISTYIEVGKDIKGLVPFVGYSYDSLRRGGFKEDAEWGIEAKKKTYNKNSIQIGIRKEFENEKNKLDLHLVHSINLGKRNLDFDGKFIGSEVEETFKGVDLKRNTTWVGVGVTRKVNENLDVTVRYNAKIDESRCLNSQTSLGIMYKF